MNLDIKAIREAAEKATPGEWLAADNGHIYSAALNLLAVAQHCRDKDANAKHIATANPATVSAMCDEVERLREVLQHILSSDRISSGESGLINQVLNGAKQ